MKRNKQGRPIGPPHVVVGIRATAAQRAAWAAAAARDDRPLAQWVRRALDAASGNAVMGVL